MDTLTDMVWSNRAIIAVNIVYQLLIIQTVGNTLNIVAAFLIKWTNVNNLGKLTHQLSILDLCGYSFTIKIQKCSILTINETCEIKPDHLNKTICSNLYLLQWL